MDTQISSGIDKWVREATYGQGRTDVETGV